MDATSKKPSPRFVRSRKGQTGDANHQDGQENDDDTQSNSRRRSEGKSRCQYTRIGLTPPNNRKKTRFLAGTHVHVRSKLLLGHEIGTKRSPRRRINRDFSQEEIYSELCRPLLEKSMEGYNATVFAYGQVDNEILLYIFFEETMIWFRC